MAYSARAVANFFIDKAQSLGITLTPLKLQKLVYYAHGWHLALKGEPLITETIEAWQFGPVIHSLYHEFRDLGSAPITRNAQKFKLVGDEVKSVIPRIPNDAVEDRAFLERIWDVYKDYTAIQLSNMTHAPGSPWSKVVEPFSGKPPEGLDIPDAVIEDYFKKAAD